MQIPTGTLEAIGDAISAALEQLTPATDASAAARGAAGDLALLSQAFDQFMDVIERIEADSRVEGDSRTSHSSDPGDITELGEYALKLLENLAALDNESVAREPGAQLAIEFGVWIARHGGQIDNLEPVVDGLASLGNQLSEPHDLEVLSAIMAEICNAASPVIREDLERVNPGRPWRVLLLNRSIIATRSHNPDLMEEAFAVLTQYLPEDAARFFTEGMQQMDALDYPAHVRKVMEKYHRQWTLSRSLH
jgi:hypothetical protein